MTRSPETTDPDWARYPDTILTFAHRAEGLQHPVRIDLRQPVAASDVDALKAAGLSGPFAVITAQDPLGEDLGREENAARAWRLKQALAEHGAWYVDVEACSPDASHCESSVATTLSYEEAVELARAFGQMAIFWFDGELFWIVGVLADSDPIALPRSR